MKPARGPVRETRFSAVVNPLEGAPPGQPVQISGVARIDAGKRTLRDNGYSTIDAKFILIRSRGNVPLKINNRRDLIPE
ncbi:hypothetical protein ALC53_05769 [Atta colombica]|uniref:Uncharacterized protein n=1 Tax=Atta colombica TaxID=520822 RepID=A0A151I3P2_9HYME|nr:hypothetical protein ALC53_05769 [Atta colombica]